MRFMKAVVATVLLAASSAAAFLNIRKSTTAKFRTLNLTPEDLTNMMAKAHAEKIRAMKDIEDKKNAEIQTLKNEVETLKINPATSTAPGMVVSKNFSLDITNMSKEQLAGRLSTYQQFMSKYIVEAQEHKRKAVEAAKAAVAARYEQKLKLYETKTPTPPAELPGTKLYGGRNASVAAAAKAGKSRWGDLEVSKAQATSSANGAKVHVNGAVVPAVELAQITVSSGSSLYYLRNQRVALGGVVGKSRWGEAEVERTKKEAAKRIASGSSSTAHSALSATSSPAKVVVTPGIVAADLGIGVAPTLAERVNLGEQLFAGNGKVLAPLPPAVLGNAVLSLYDSRNVRVAAAAAADRSRWGSMENERATNLSSNALLKSGSSSSTVAVAVPPEVETAHHRMRADGGVGVPSLARRVNLGADLLAS